MSLFEDLEQEAHVLSTFSPSCKVCQWLQTIEDKQRVATKIEEWYQDDLPHMNLWRTLRRNGFLGSESSLRRHRENCFPKGHNHVA